MATIIASAMRTVCTEVGRLIEMRTTLCDLLENADRLDEARVLSASLRVLQEAMIGLQAGTDTSRWGRQNIETILERIEQEATNDD